MLAELGGRERSPSRRELADFKGKLRGNRPPPSGEGVDAPRTQPTTAHAASHTSLHHHLQHPGKKLGEYLPLMLVRDVGSNKVVSTFILLLLLLLHSITMAPAFLLPSGAKTLRRSLTSWLKRAAASGAPVPGRWNLPSSVHLRSTMSLHSSSKSSHVHNPLFDDVPDRGYVSSTCLSPNSPLPIHTHPPKPAPPVSSIRGRRGLRCQVAATFESGGGGSSRRRDSCGCLIRVQQPGRV